MPIPASRFHSPAFLHNEHIQTILPALLPRRLGIAFERERSELEDGDFLDLDWARMGGDKLAILSHGLQECSDDGYNRGIGDRAPCCGMGETRMESPRMRERDESATTVLSQRRDWRFGGSDPVRGHEVFADRADWIQPRGNLTLKYLGEARPHPAVIGAVAISGRSISLAAREPSINVGAIGSICALYQEPDR
jgi:hypothetical protein